MDLSPLRVSESFADDKHWIGSQHGTDSCFSVTLDLTKFADYAIDLGDGRKRIPSGIPVVKNGAKYEPALTRPGGVDTQAATCEGHTFEGVVFNATSTVAGAAVQWHGVVRTAQIPKPTAYAAAFDTAKGSKHIKYV